MTKKKVYKDTEKKRKHPWRVWTGGGFSSDKNARDKIIPLAERMGVGA